MSRPDWWSLLPSDDQAQVGPHEFLALRRIDKFRREGRCRYCFVARADHPILFWAPARAFGDTRRSLTDRKRAFGRPGDHAEALAAAEREADK